MTLPRWDDPKLEAGAMVRGALWLIQEVGEGNTFTKSRLRHAFPDVTQIDRRIRDLRDYGWEVHANNQDASLALDDQRFVRAGVPVWNSEARRAASPQRAVSAKERQAALARDLYICTLCGIAGGDEYLDDSNQTAVLGVYRTEVELPNGVIERILATECKRCHAGSERRTATLEQACRAFRALTPEDRARLARWIERGRRGASPIDRAWDFYQRLPIAERPSARTALDS